MVEKPFKISFRLCKDGNPSLEICADSPEEIAALFAKTVGLLIKQGVYFGLDQE